MSNLSREQAASSLEELRQALIRRIVRDQGAIALTEQINAAGFGVGVELRMWLRPLSEKTDAVEAFECQLMDAAKEAIHASTSVWAIYQCARMLGISLECGIDVYQVALTPEEEAELEAEAEAEAEPKSEPPAPVKELPPPIPAWETLAQQEKILSEALRSFGPQPTDMN